MEEMSIDRPEQNVNMLNLVKNFIFFSFFIK